MYLPLLRCPAFSLAFACVVCRPRPLAQVAYSATGSAPIAPRSVSFRYTNSDLSSCFKSSTTPIPSPGERGDREAVGEECACDKFLESLKLFEKHMFSARIPHPTSLSLGHLPPGGRHWVVPLTKSSTNWELQKIQKLSMKKGRTVVRPFIIRYKSIYIIS